jgi:hypothetical protein
MTKFRHTGGMIMSRLASLQKKVYFCKKSNMSSTVELTDEKSNTVGFEQLMERGCGMDVHKSLPVATIRGTGIKEETREYGACTEDITSLGAWLKKNGVTHVAMESTGVYRKPVFNIPKADFEIIPVNARHIKNIPGHRTDKKDSRRIARLLLVDCSRGVLSRSYRYVNCGI